MRVKYCGIGAAFVLWSLVAIALAISDMSLLGDKSLGFLSAEPNTDLIYSTALVVSAVLFIGFHGYLQSRYPISRSFTITLFAGIAGQFTAGLLPVQQDSVATIHTLGVLLRVSSLPIVVLTFFLTQPPGRWRRFCGLLVGLQLATSVLGLVLVMADYPVLAQLVPTAGFHVWVLTVTFKPRRDALPVPDARHLPLSVPDDPLPVTPVALARAEPVPRFQGPEDDDDHGPLAEARQKYLQATVDLTAPEPPGQSLRATRGPSDPAEVAR